jgi:hypothetical protein
MKLKIEEKENIKQIKKISEKKRYISEKSILERLGNYLG